MAEKTEDGRKITPAMEQWQAAKSAHPDKVLFFRMGDFYEMFYDDARLCADKLGLTLTSRDKGQTPMAGVPHHQCDRYLRELLALGFKVAICDQLEDPAQAKGLVKRGITRVVTPGTVLEDDCLSGREHNFLAAAVRDGESAALACADVSTGEFFVTLLTLEALGDELERLSPAETLLPEGWREHDPALAAALKFRGLGAVTERDGRWFNGREGERLLLAHFDVRSLAGFGLDGEPAAAGAAGALLRYLAETEQSSLAHIRTLRRVDRVNRLLLDRATQRNLELVRPLHKDGRGGTLLKVLDRTRTGPGGRLLKYWLLAPPARLEPIRRRQEAVAELARDHLLRAELRELLSGISDIERIMARVVTGRANARDLAALGASVNLLPALAELGKEMRAPLLSELAERIDPLADVGGWIAAELADDPPAVLREGGMIRAGFDSELDELRAIARGGKDWIAAFQESERARAGIPSLKVGFNRVFGYYIEITRARGDKVPEDYERKQTLVNAERYITPELKEYESKVLGAEERIWRLEYELFCQLRERVAGEVARAQTVARALAELDCLAALAETGAAGNYVMPELHEGVETAIVGGRHPVLETMIPDGEFVANDTAFDPEKSRMLIITGPNMAGKSTYIRQVALLTVMAHLGCGVPAESARIGLADRIFTRVGAADDLARGQSTFMVEMSETANILNNATARSLVILDEVGRGTSTFDGVSLAWAITEYLCRQTKCRTLFATHYHELAELGIIMPGAANLNVAVRDWGGEIIFMHKIQPGSCDRSYGIQVGRLAGLPPAVLDRAREILEGLEEQAAARDFAYVGDAEVLRAAAREVQLDLFAAQPPARDQLREELAALDPDRLSPLDAHGLLRRLAALAKQGK